MIQILHFFIVFWKTLNILSNVTKLFNYFEYFEQSIGIFLV